MSQVMVLALLVMFLAVFLVGIALLAVSGPAHDTAAVHADRARTPNPPGEPAETHRA